MASGKAEVPSSPLALIDFLQKKGFQNAVLNRIKGMSTVVCIFYRSNSLGSYNYVRRASQYNAMWRAVYTVHQSAYALSECSCLQI